MSIATAIKDKKYVFRGQRNLQIHKVDPKIPLPHFTEVHASLLKFESTLENYN